MRRLLFLALLVAQPPVTAAEPRAASSDTARSHAPLVFYVDDEGGVFDLPVHHDVVTTLYFPDKVVKLFCPHLADFHVDAPIDRLVTIRPKHPGKLTGNVQIVSGSVKASLNLHAGRREDAAQQVYIRRRRVEERFREEVDRRMEQRVDEIAGEAARAAETALARQVLEGVETRSPGAVDRNDDNVIARIPRVVWIGGAAYITFEIQNRHDRPFEVSAVRVRHQGREIAGYTVNPAGRRDASFRVGAGLRQRGLVVLPDAAAIAGPVSVVFEGGARGGSLRVASVALR